MSGPKWHLGTPCELTLKVGTAFGTGFRWNNSNMPAGHWIKPPSVHIIRIQDIGVGGAHRIYPACPCHIMFALGDLR